MSATAYKRVYLQGIDISANVRSVEVEDHDRLIDRAVVVLDDPRGTASEAPREGNTLLVDLGWGDNHAVVFEGEVTQVATQEAGCDPRQVTLTALDLAYRLRKRPFSATNHVGLLSAILQRMLTRDPNTGVAVGQIEPDPDPEYTEAAPLRQSTQNDWDFIVEQARRANCRAFVEYNAGASKFYFIPVPRLLAGDPLGTLGVGTMAGRILRFHYERTGSRAAPRLETVAVDASTGDTVATPAPTAPVEPPHTPGATAADTGGASLDSALAVAAEATELPDSHRPVALRPGVPSDPARAAAEAVQDPTLALGFTARGACVGTVMLRAKGSVDVTGVAGWGAGRWYVRRVKHLLRSNGGGGMAPAYSTEFELTR
jgi:phage protein D